jgi:hypothetical protein
MELLATFYKPDTIDCYTFVFDELNPGGYNTMLALSEDGYTFSQWTEGLYDRDGDNEHLGARVDFHHLGKRILNAFFSRIAS